MAKITINPDSLIRVSTAALLKGTTRQTIYYHAQLGSLSMLEIDGVQFVPRAEIANLKIRRKPKKNNGKINTVHKTPDTSFTA